MFNDHESWLTMSRRPLRLYIAFVEASVPSGFAESGVEALFAGGTESLPSDL
jgi:hypothetical protein